MFNSWAIVSCQSVVQLQTAHGVTRDEEVIDILLTYARKTLNR